MKVRFEGEEGMRRLIAALQSQKICAGDEEIASKFAAVAELHDVATGTAIITQGTNDNDAYFILAGAFSVVVEGHEVGTRHANDCVGEMAAIDPSLPRTATIVAKEASVVAKVSEPNFIRTADAHPKMWRALSQELAKRLDRRKEMLIRPNDRPRLFIISSREALDTARFIQQILERDALVQVWTDGVFFASGYALEALEAAVADSDFAIAIAQPDDVAISRGAESRIARDNVIFELGLFMGDLGRRRTILFQPEGQPLKLPSDLQGLTAIAYQTGEARDMPALLGAPCTTVRQLIRDLGVRK